MLTAERISLVDIEGLFESGGVIKLRSLRRDEFITTGQTISSSGESDPQMASKIAGQDHVPVWDDLTPNDTLMLFQMYSERIGNRVSVLSRCRGPANEFSDLIRYAVYWCADPQYRRLHSGDV